MGSVSAHMCILSAVHDYPTYKKETIPLHHGFTVLKTSCTPVALCCHHEDVLLGDHDRAPSPDALLFAHCLPYTYADNGGVCQCITQSTEYASVQYSDTTITPYLLYTVCITWTTLV